MGPNERRRWPLAYNIFPFVKPPLKTMERLHEKGHLTREKAENVGI